MSYTVFYVDKKPLDKFAEQLINQQEKSCQCDNNRVFLLYERICYPVLNPRPELLNTAFPEKLGICQ